MQSQATRIEEGRVRGIKRRLKKGISNSQSDNQTAGIGRASASIMDDSRSTSGDGDLQPSMVHFERHLLEIEP
jgi:uncharacterized protein (UPF0254 family)